MFPATLVLYADSVPLSPVLGSTVFGSAPLPPVYSSIPGLHSTPPHFGLHHKLDWRQFVPSPPFPSFHSSPAFLHSRPLVPPPLPQLSPVPAQGFTSAIDQGEHGQLSSSRLTQRVRLSSQPTSQPPPTSTHQPPPSTANTLSSPAPDRTGLGLPLSPAFQPAQLTRTLRSPEQPSSVPENSPAQFARTVTSARQAFTASPQAPDISHQHTHPAIKPHRS